jgi:MFS family permease
VIGFTLSKIEETGAIGSAWRWMFVIGAVPALLAIVIRRKLKEPEQWQSLSDDQLKKKLGSYGELFSSRWRKNAFVGLFLAFAGVVGLWSIGFYSFDLNRSVFRKTFESEARSQGEASKDQQFLQTLIAHPEWLDKADPKITPQPSQLLSSAPGQRDPELIYVAVREMRKADKEITVDTVLDAMRQPAADGKQASSEERARLESYLKEGGPGSESQLSEHGARIVARSKAIESKLGFWVAVTSVMLNTGAFFGIYFFTYVTHYIGRRPAFAMSFLMAFFSTFMVFGYLTEFSQIFWMIPIMGFCQLSLFGGYAIYFPELFPTHLRSTGTSFCYNVGRFVAATGPITLGALIKYVFVGYPEPMRYAGMWMSGIFILGMLALPFAPETKGKPLPE